MLDPKATVPSAQLTALLLSCIDFVSDALLITEAQPLDEPGPRIVFVNRAFERMTGYDASEVLGRTPRFLQGPGTDRAELARVRDALVTWQAVRAQLVNYRKNGDAFHVEMDIVPISDASGRWTHWVSVQRNVTERKRAEAELLAREMQRVEALGTLSSGVAHDFNNIIAAILGNVAVGSLDMEAGQMPLGSMEQIRIAALRARSVVAKILAYKQRRSTSTVAVALEPIVREATDLLRPMLPDGARLDVTGPATPLWVRGDSSQLYQVVLNLGVNALQALEGGPGRIRFALAAEGDAAPCDRPLASIEVSDTGCGMDAETRGRIFEPYFTTKTTGNGTGLGLSVVWGIVAAHEGSIAVESEPGQGTRIKLSLPRLPEVAGESPAPPSSVVRRALGHGEHVLVVDDDEVVVMMLEAMLKRWGFRVTALQDPLQAVRAVREAPDAFDAVVTDLNMPHISGLQLARELLAVRRDIPVLLGSGTVSDDVVEQASEVGVAAVFPKEFAVEQLGPLLRDALSRSSRSGPHQPP